MSSKNSIKQVAGHRARNVGLLFETHLEIMTEKHGGTCVKIPNSGRVVGTGHQKKFVKMKSPFDFMIVKEGRACVLDCKAINKTSLPFSLLKQHQLKELAKCAPHIPAGYLVWFQTTDQVVWFEVSILATLKPRESLSPQDGQQLGTTQWGYNPTKLLSD